MPSTPQLLQDLLPSSYFSTSYFSLLLYFFICLSLPKFVDKNGQILPHLGRRCGMTSSPCPRNSQFLLNPQFEVGLYANFPSSMLEFCLTHATVGLTYTVTICKLTYSSLLLCMRNTVS